MARTTRRARPRRASKKRAGVPARKGAARPARNAGLTLAMFQVDAFTSRRFHGNPAAVVLLERKWLSDELMQRIAAENNLAETAFVLPKGFARVREDDAGGGKGSATTKRGGASVRVPRFRLRWFTPTVEVDLCGHATLATAHVLWNHVGLGGERVVFDSMSGALPVYRLPSAGSAEGDGSGDLIVLDFPRRPGVPCAVSDDLCAALGGQPDEAYKTSTMVMAVFDNRREVYALRPDMQKVAAFGGVGVIATAPGSGHDFVSRFFAPAAGVPEDPVTGSAHSVLTPYWARRLKKESLRAHQVSSRGGELWVEDTGTRVHMGGHAVTYLEGRIRV